MNDDLVAVQSETGNGFVELARSQKGRLFRKQILPMNESFTHPSAPGKRIHIDEAFAKTLQANFRNKICDIVQVPVVDDANRHVEDPLRNAGEVVDLTYDDTGVYATFDARKYAEDFGTTLLGASALMHMNYSDTKTGKQVGPTLLHMAVTNRPYLTDLKDFEEVVAMSAADTSSEKPVVLIPATKQEEKMDLDQMLAVLKDEHDIDVAALQSKADTNTNELVTALSNVLGDATGKPKGDDVTIKDVADAVIELAEERVALSAQVETLAAANEQHAQAKAEAEVDGLIRQGRILPKQRSTMIALSRENREAFDSLVPDDAIVSLSADGVDTFDEPKVEQMKQNIERLANLANGN